MLGALVAVILGTRPEIVKLAPVVRALRERAVRHVVIHSNQHYSAALDAVFWADLNLPPADVNLGVGSGSQGVQTGRMLERMEQALMQHAPAIVVAQGDTNTVLAAALTAAKLHIPFGHVEAGLRSFDRTMPEEVNRVVADHVATWLYAPTQRAVQNLAREGITGDRVVLTGNTGVDALRQHVHLATSRPRAYPDLPTGAYILVTLHRAENTDSRPRLQAIVQALARVAAEHGRPLAFPVHPRTERVLAETGLNEELRRVSNLLLLPPLGYLDFLALQQGAACVLTDSGGVQEESCVLGVPCVTLRDNTERPETVEVGANMLAGATVDGICTAVRSMLTRRRDWRNPFGDGHAGDQVAAHLERCGGSAVGSVRQLGTPVGAAPRGRLATDPEDPRRLT